MHLRIRTATLPIVLAGTLLGLWFAVGRAAQTATRTVCASGCDHTTIQAAISAASPGDRIQVQDAQHFEQGITVDRNVTIAGQGRNTTQVLGNNTDTIFRINGAFNVTIQDMYISRGQPPGLSNGGGVDNCGGAVRMERVELEGNRAASAGAAANRCGGAMTIVESMIDYNTASLAAGALGNYDTSVMTLIDTLVLNNTADGSASNGGGIFNAGTLIIQRGQVNENQANDKGGGVYNSGQATIDGPQIAINTAATDGGGVYNSGTLTLTNAALQRNAAQYGGNLLVQSGALANLENVWISEGQADFGGGIFNVGGLTVRTGTVRENRADPGSGGGIFNETGASLTLLGTDVFSNTTKTTGGGVHNQGTMTLGENAVIRNNAADGNGGGVYNFKSDSSVFADSTFRANRGFEGGGLINEQSSPNMRDLLFIENTAVAGGGLYNRTQSSPTVRNVAFRGNTVSNDGGAITNASGSQPTFTNVLVSGGHAFDGGGLSERGGSQPTYINLTLSGNRAWNTGGGLFNDGSSQVSLANSILWNNQDSTGAGTLAANLIRNSGGVNIHHSLVQGSGGSASWNSAAGTDGGANLDADPTFTQAGSPSSTPNSGGDYTLLPGSPAIDAGDNSVNVTVLDLAGLPRQVNGVIDLGAYESVPLEILETYPTARNDSARTREETPVTVDVLANDSDPNGDSLVLVSVGGTTDGSARVENGKVTFTPRSGFSGFTSFFYVIHDGDPTHTARAGVNVTVDPVNDPPTGISLSASSIEENEPAGSVVGLLQADDPEGNGPFNFFLTTTDGVPDQDNEYFFVSGAELRTRFVLDFESMKRFTLQVRVVDGAGASFTGQLTVDVLDGNDAPTAIQLSNNRLDENKPAGTTVGVLSSTDPDTGDSHSYVLASGSGSNNNASFRIEEDALKTAAPLDYETLTIYSVRVRSMDSAGGQREQVFSIYVNNLDDAPVNTLSNCSGNDITLIDEPKPSLGTEVQVKIVNISVSNVTAGGCTVDGQMTITAHGGPATRISNGAASLAFHGVVNGKNQFSSSTISNFNLNLVGMTFIAKQVTVVYHRGQPGLQISGPRIAPPRNWGGPSVSASNYPMILDGAGLKVSSGVLRLPTLRTKNGVKLNISGGLKAVSGGYQIIADGSVSIPNIGKNKKAGKKGQTCTIGAGVTLFVSNGRDLVLEITPKEKPQTPVQPVVFVPTEGDAAQQLALDEIRLKWSCDQGIPIGNTGFFITGMSGKITLTPSNEQIDVRMTITGGKKLPGLGPVVTADGGMNLKFSPFRMKLDASLKVFVFTMAQAEATITPKSFSATINVNRTLYHGTASVNAWSAPNPRTRVEQFHMTGSGLLTLEVRKHSMWETCGTLPCGVRTCDVWWSPVRLPCGVKTCYSCIGFPPVQVGPLAGVGVQVGEFTNGNWGFKGFVSILGQSAGFFIDHKGSFDLGNVNTYRLVKAPTVRAARMAWRQASRAAQASVDPKQFGPYTFLEDDQGRAVGVIVDAPLKVDGSAAIQARDAISSVNLIPNADALFVLTAQGPLNLTLVTPGGKEINPTNYQQADAAYAGVSYTRTVGYALQREETPGAARLRFTPLSMEAAVNNVDLRVDGSVALSNITYQDMLNLDALTLAPGDHLIDLVTTGTDTVVLQTFATLTPDHTYSLLTIGATPARIDSRLLVVEDDISPPNSQGAARVRFFNAASANLDMYVDGALFRSSVAPLSGSTYGELAAGEHTVEFRYSSGGQPASPTLAANLQEGDVYTFFAVDFSSGSFLVGGVQRLDELYAPDIRTEYGVDQAVVGEWQAKISGDTDGIYYQLAVIGPDSPPVLASLSVDASDLANTAVGWQLTADRKPVTVTVYVNPGSITTTLTITDANGAPAQQTIPAFEGFPVAEFVIDDPNQLGGQQVTQPVDLSGLASGTYHLWVRAADGTGATVNGYAASANRLRAAPQDHYGYNSVRAALDGYNALAQATSAAPIVVNHANDFPTAWTANISTTLDAATGDLLIEWGANSHPDVDAYLVHVGASSVITAGDAVVEYDADGLATGPATGFAILPNVEPALPYTISVEALDTTSGRSVRSQEVVFQASAGDFQLSAGQSEWQAAPGGQVDIPVTFQEIQALFQPTARLRVVLSQAPRGVSAGFTGDDEGAGVVVSKDVATATLQVLADASTPPGRYPLQVIGDSSGLQRTLDLTLVVGNPQQSIFLPVVVR